MQHFCINICITFHKIEIYFAETPNQQSYKSWQKEKYNLQRKRDNLVQGCEFTYKFVICAKIIRALEFLTNCDRHACGVEHSDTTDIVQGCGGRISFYYASYQHCLVIFIYTFCLPVFTISLYYYLLGLLTQTAGPAESVLSI